MQQINRLHKSLYQINKVDTTKYTQLAYERKEKLEQYDKLIAEKCSQKTALETLKISRATYYRWRKNYKFYGLAGLEEASRRPNNVRKPLWDANVEKKVLHIRKINPLWGKEKIAAVLKRDYSIKKSVSTIGRILSKLIKEDKVKAAYFYMRGKKRKPRTFDDHAKPWTRDMKAKKPGEYIPIDHMSISEVPDKTIKHFKAICPITKIIVAQAYPRADSCSATKFLEHARRSLPFPMLSAQVDGGSEFRGEFEQACKELNIPLFVLPPRSPKYNGNVERGNCTVKYEFYVSYTGASSLRIIQKNLQKYIHRYNNYQTSSGFTKSYSCAILSEIKGRPSVSYVMNQHN